MRCTGMQACKLMYCHQCLQYSPCSTTHGPPGCSWRTSELLRRNHPRNPCSTAKRSASQTKTAKKVCVGSTCTLRTLQAAPVTHQLA